MRHSESRDRLLNAVSWCWLVLGLAFGVYLLLPLRHPDASGHTAHAYSSEQRELTPVSFRQEPVRTHATRKIEDISVGDRVLAFNPLLSPEEHLAPDPNAGEWRQIDLAITKADGYRLDITLLRPVDWLEALEARLGGPILLDIPEMNAYGEAQVLSISQCPPIRPGDGRVVVGKFRHTSGDIIDLGVSGVSEPIGTTADHPFWSETREEFVEAGDLKIGELLLSVTGEVIPVTSLSRRGPPEPVYNLQVHSEHVYFVSSEGVLVHNYDPPTATKGGLNVLDAQFTPNAQTLSKVTAYDFYTRQAGFSPSRALQHMEGIDFSRPVTPVTIPYGTTAQQFVGPRGTGHYFAAYGSTPLQSGIPSLRQSPTLFQSFGDIPALQSFTRPDYIYPPGAVVPGSGAGNGLQYFVPNNGLMVPITR